VDAKQQSCGFSQTFVLKFRLALAQMRLKPKGQLIFIDIWLKPVLVAQSSPLAKASGNLFEEF